MDLKKIDFKSPSTIAALAGSILVILGSFLPVSKVDVSIMKESYNLMGSYGHHGIFHLILAIAIVVLLVLGKEKIMSGVIAAEVIWAVIDIRNVISDVNDANKLIKGSASTQFGLYVLIIGAVALVVALVLASLKAKKSSGPAAQPMM